MTIILDVTRLLRRLIKGRTLTGIDRVTLAYVHHYADKACALLRWSGRSFILSQSHSNALFAWLKTPGSTVDGRLIVIKGILSKRAINRHTPLFLLNTGHIGLGQSDYRRLIRQYDIQPIFFVHDLIPILYPEYCSAGEDMRHKEKMNVVLSLAKGVITNSEATLHDLMNYSKQTNQPMPRAEVALLAGGIQATSTGSRPIDKPYFVMLSTIEPRKNHLLLLQLWRNLFKRLRSDTPHLFVIGQRGWECENSVDLLDRCPMLKSVVTEVAHCPDSELVTYIQHSQALLFPSFVEGYGLPLVEALELGVPVIASDLPVFYEIAGDIPEYVDPLDGKRWEALILDYAKPQSELRAAQMTRLHHFKGPTWEKHFTIVDSLLAGL